MNNNTFAYTNFLLDEIKEIKGDKIILKNKSLNDFANDYMWRTDAELSTLDATYPLDLSFKFCVVKLISLLHCPHKEKECVCKPRSCS